MGNARGDRPSALPAALRGSADPYVRWWSGLRGNVRGALWMLAGGAGFTLMTVCIKLAGQTLPVWEIIVLRALFALLVLAPAIARSPGGTLRTRRFGAHLFRCLLGFCGVSTMMLAITNLDLALATTLGFARTLFMIVLAVAFLGEVVRWRRTSATLVGFGGVVLCVQPWGAEFSLWALVGLAAAAFAAGVTTMIKRLTATEPPLRILFWSYVLIGTMALGPSLLVWRPPSLQELAYIAFMGLFSAWGQSCMVNALRVGEATAVAPFEYSRLLFAAGLGFLLFQEVPSPWTWLGALVIVASTLYIVLREARLGRSHPPAAPAGDP